MSKDINNNIDLSIPKVQDRLELLGYNLGSEAKQGLYGEKTAIAVAAFKHSAHLPQNDVLDQETWIALVDASLQLGERTLFLHMPHFEGRDVRSLQIALSSLGFACNNDGVFGPNTERALRDFQQNVAIEANGICAEKTVLAIERLRHAWDGKRGVFIEGRNLGYTRAAEVLETTAICVFGTDKTTRSIADKISNLALATTPRSQVVSAAFLANGPSKDMLMVGIYNIQTNHEDFSIDPKELIPLVSKDDVEGLVLMFRAALGSSSGMGKRINIDIQVEPDSGKNISSRQEQYCAIAILDALCAVFV
jgi:peptidoglycan hydrolase-like protein with peptidoglycan-binding domain